MSWTDGKLCIVTIEDVHGMWNGGSNGKFFRCYLCGHKFNVGDKWRFVLGCKFKCINLMVCKKCDGTNEEVIERFKLLNLEFNSPKFWKLRQSIAFNDYRDPLIKI